jgi:hypothetical protein
LKTENLPKTAGVVLAFPYGHTVLRRQDKMDIDLSADKKMHVATFFKGMSSLSS